MTLEKTETIGYVIAATVEKNGKKQVYPVVPSEQSPTSFRLQSLSDFWTTIQHADEAFRFTRIDGALNTLMAFRNRHTGLGDVYVAQAQPFRDLPGQNYNLHALRVSQVFHEVAWGDAKDVADFVAIGFYLNHHTDRHGILRRQFTAAHAKLNDLEKEIAPPLRQNNHMMSGYAAARMTKSGDIFYQGRGHVSMPKDYNDGNRDIAGARNHSVVRYAIAAIHEFATIEHGRAEIGERFFVAANSFTLDPEPTCVEALMRLEADAIIARMPVHLRDAAHRLKDKAPKL